MLISKIDDFRGFQKWINIVNQNYQFTKIGSFLFSRVHKNRWLEEERATPIEARSQVKIMEPY